MLDILFFNVGHGDSIALKFPDDTWGIIDCNKNKRQKEPNVLKFLKDNNIHSLRFICLTHPHKDHFLGLFDVINYCDNVEKLILYELNIGCKAEKDKKGTIFKVIYNFSVDKKMPSENIILAKNKNICQITDEVKFEFLSPTEDIIKNYKMNTIYREKRSAVNCLSVVIKIFYKNKIILLCADAQGENWALLDEEIDADIIKISHHGSYENNKPEYLNKIINTNSHISIISSDGGKLYKSIPSKKVVDYLEGLHSAKVLKTYNLTVKTSKKKIASSSLLIDAAMENVGNDVSVETYDGAIKLSIKDDGEIRSDIYKTVEEIEI